MASNSRYLREGIVAGLIGAAIIAVWFLIYDAARGRPFRTPALLGAAAPRPQMDLVDRERAAEPVPGVALRHPGGVRR